MNKTLRTILALVCIGLITVCSILLVSYLTGRARLADLTEHRLYTLSGGTERILGQLNQPITLRLYYSRVAARKGPEQIRFWNTYFLYVRDILDEYVKLSKGMLRLEVIDPRPFSEEEEGAVTGGVRRFQLSDQESFFFGLVATTELGKTRVIEFFEPERQEFVEYDISKLISGLIQREKKKVGVLSSLPVTGTEMSPYMMQMLQLQGKMPEGPWAVVEHLRTGYDVEPVRTDNATIPADVDFLVLVHPKHLEEETLFAIDQYVMKGGKLVVFVDPFCMVDQPMRDPRNPFAGMDYDASSDLNGLLETWGVRMDPERIAVDRALATTVQLQRDRPPAPLPAYLKLDETCVNHDQVITAELHTLQMLFAGALTKVSGAGTDVRMLLQTSPVGSTWKPSGPFELRMPDPQKINQAVIDGTEPVMLACLITGRFKTNFPDGIPQKKHEEEEGEEKETDEKKDEEKPEASGEQTKDDPEAAASDKPEDADKEPAEAAKDEAAKEDTRPSPPVLKESSEGAMVVVVSDVDMITDMLAYRETFFGLAQVGNNASLVLNVMDYLGGSGDLISVRTRGRYSRPFKVVDAIEQEADKATEAEVAALNDKIDAYQKQLQELGSGAGETDVKLIHNEAIAKRRNIEAEIRKANKELRRLQAKRRVKVEALAAVFQWANMVAAPAIIALIAIVLAVFRWARAKQYAARRD